MHKIEAKGILSQHNGMNLYRGCTHGCIYCDSRSACYHMTHAFEDIEVKQNSIALLANALKHKRKKCMIHTGSMSDPYLPLEMELGYTRAALELIYEYGFGVTLHTKSDLILRDVELLRRIHQKTKCVVQMTITTLDETLCQKLEPNVCTTQARYAALKQLQKMGIPTVVWLSPILPFLNDTVANVCGIVDLCIDAGVYGVLCLGMGMTLRKGNREYFYQQLDRMFPTYKDKYIHTFGDRYWVESPAHRELSEQFFTACEQGGLVHDPQKLFTYMNAFSSNPSPTQITLWDPSV